MVYSRCSKYMCVMWSSAARARISRWQTILGFLSFDGYFSALWYFLLLGEGLGLFDLVIIDLFWWRNTRRICFSFLPDRAAYQDPSKHSGLFVRGIPLFAVVAALSAAIVTLV